MRAIVQAHSQCMPTVMFELTGLAVRRDFLHLAHTARSLDLTGVTYRCTRRAPTLPVAQIKL